MEVTRDVYNLEVTRDVHNLEVTRDVYNLDFLAMLMVLLHLILFNLAIVYCHC